MLLTRRTITMPDAHRLRLAVEGTRRDRMTYMPHLDRFKAELRRTPPVPSREVAPDVVTMNSRFILRDSVTGERREYTLVYPGHESPELGRVSVLSRMGTALLGARAGDEVCWMSHAGPEVAVIERLTYQPEAAGNEYL